MNQENNETSAESNPGGEASEVKTSAAESAATNEAKKPATNKKSAKPNLQFVGKQSRWNKKKVKQEIVPREAPAFIIDGREKVNLPIDLGKGAVAVDADVAQRVKQLFPADFKTPTAK